MDIATLQMVRTELEAETVGRRFGKIFVLSRFEMAIDLRLTDSRYLFISVEPANPRIYLIRRRLRDLEKRSGNPSPFVLQLRKQLSGAEAASVEQLPDERVLKLNFRGRNELGEEIRRGLVVQLTGRSANLFLVDETGRIVDSLRETTGDGQETATTYSPPLRPVTSIPAPVRPSIGIDEVGENISDALDAADLERKEELEFRSLANAARASVGQEIKKLEKLRDGLQKDLKDHGEAEKWKRFGDLLLANSSTAKRRAGSIVVTDYFDENAPEIEIGADDNDTVTAVAEKYFRKYTKARNAQAEIAARLEETRSKLEKLAGRRDAIEQAVDEGDADLLAEFSGGKQAAAGPRKKTKGSPLTSVARVFESSDGFEILVGKKAKDNDQLTFKIAKSLDTWMHAADYPGSHVVIRNPNRKEIPHRTLVEAAELAAFYSQGKAQPKAAVHYTQKKFVNKPKGSAPGLVSLASFKTLLVEPKVTAELIR